MPRSRFKLAIPFVGKDVPARASEFAHPDVIIGLTVLAYRYAAAAFPFLFLFPLSFAFVPPHASTADLWPSRTPRAPATSRRPLQPLRRGLRRGSAVWRARTLTRASRPASRVLRRALSGTRGCAALTLRTT